MNNVSMKKNSLLLKNHECKKRGNRKKYTVLHMQTSNAHQKSKKDIHHLNASFNISLWSKAKSIFIASSILKNRASFASEPD